MDPSESHQLSDPWGLISGALAAELEARLVAECAPGHALYGVKAEAVAKCFGCDDVLFRVPAGWALVHLTWSSAPETPPSPRTSIAPTVDDALLQALEH